MALQTIRIAQGEILHAAGETVNTIDVIVQGSIRISSAFTQITLKAGCMPQLAETPGEEYRFYYEAAEDCTICSYDYNDASDIGALIRSNPNIRILLASESLKMASTFSVAMENLMSATQAELSRVRTSYEDYPLLCARLHETKRAFPEVENLTDLSAPVQELGWRTEFVSSMVSHDADLRKTYYGISPEITTGVILTGSQYILDAVTEIQRMTEFRSRLMQDTADFMITYQGLRDRLETMAESQRTEAQASGEGVPVITNALGTILEFAEIPEEQGSAFREKLQRFDKAENHLDTSDEMRMLRRELTAGYYQIYAEAFLKCQEKQELPLVLKLFFLFGFMDEHLAGQENTEQLILLAEKLRPDEKGRILTGYEWLQKIYRGEVEPSRNEFDLNYQEWVRDRRKIGEITQTQEAELLKDLKEKVRFEIRNLFALGSRMTFGRVTSFLPIFDGQNLYRTASDALLTPGKVRAVLDELRKDDYSLFCREHVMGGQELGISNFMYRQEILPYIILLPEIGGGSALWQEMEGKKRTTPGRMLLPVLDTESLADQMLKLCGEFHWEICKSEQGIHWNDVTDPSLTALYCDYLQFFRKNHSLSDEQKDKIKETLKKYGNNFKKAFVADYMSYMLYERKGSLRLNKTAREILFTYCPLRRELRDRLRDNPQYKQLIEQHDQRCATQLHLIAGVRQKATKVGMDVPVEVRQQEHFLNQ